MKHLWLGYLVVASFLCARPEYHGIYFKAQIPLQSVTGKLYSDGKVYGAIAKQNPQVRIGYNHGFEKIPLDLALEVGPRSFPVFSEMNGANKVTQQYKMMQFHSVWVYRFPVLEGYLNLGGVRLTKRTATEGVNTSKTWIRPIVGLGLQSYFCENMFYGVGVDWVPAYTDKSSQANSTGSIYYGYASMGYLI